MARDYETASGEWWHIEPPESAPPHLDDLPPEDYQPETIDQIIYALEDAEDEYEPDISEYYVAAQFSLRSGFRDFKIKK